MIIAVLICLLDSGRSTGGICVLADDDTAVAHQLFSGSSFRIDIIPRVGIVDIHMSIRIDRGNSKIECGVAGDNLSVVECAYVADLDISVFVIVLISELAVINKFLNLHACHDAGDIT